MGTEAGDGENENGGGTGGAADLLGTPPAGGGDGGQGGGDGGAGGAGDQQQDIQGGADPDWWGTLSADGGDADNPSNRDWIKARGTKTMDDLVKNARDAQRALRDSGRIKVPGEGASEAEVAEFKKAIGVPDDAKGYAIVAPKDEAGNDIELDANLLDAITASGLKHGAPKGVLEGVVNDFVQAQLAQAAEFDAEQRNIAAGVVKGWGAESTEKLAAVDRAGAALGLTGTDMVAVRNALGAEKALNMFAKLGTGMAEDIMLTGGRGRFGVTGAEAVAELTKLKTDTEFQAKLSAGDAAAVARWNRLNDAEAAYLEAQNRAAA